MRTMLIVLYTLRRLTNILIVAEDRYVLGLNWSKVAWYHGATVGTS